MDERLQALGITQELDDAILDTSIQQQVIDLLEQDKRKVPVMLEVLVSRREKQSTFGPEDFNFEGTKADEYQKTISIQQRPEDDYTDFIRDFWEAAMESGSWQPRNLPYNLTVGFMLKSGILEYAGEGEAPSTIALGEIIPFRLTEKAIREIAWDMDNRNAGYINTSGEQKIKSEEKLLTALEEFGFRVQELLE